jgi:purine-binding chemotaxis protein CheW
MSSGSTTTPDPSEDDVPDAPQVMLLRVAESLLAVPVGDLREVLRGRPAARVPGTPDWLRGLVNVRGALVPVADLQRKAGGPVDADPPWLVVVERDGRQAALGVTAVEGVHPVAESLPIESDAGTLPRSGAVRLQTQGSGSAVGAPDAADVLDVAALFGEIFEGD